MKPTIGRIVYYTFVNHGDGPDQGQSQTVPAIIVAVWSDTCVNLRVFQDGAAAPLWRTSVVGRSVSSGGDYWDWPQP